MNIITRFEYLLCGLIAIVVISCKEDKPYSISLNGNNLYITMPYPTIGIVGINKVDWNGVFLSDVVEDVYQQIKESAIKGECHLYVRFENVTTDKYGSKNSTFDETLLMNIPVKEVGKYQDSKYFNDYYKISEKVANVAFKKDNIILTTPKKWEDMTPQEKTDSIAIMRKQGGLEADQSKKEKLVNTQGATISLDEALQ